MRRFIFAAAALVAATAAVAGGATIRVPGDHVTIQSAIDAAVSGDTVLVAPGTYAGRVNFNNKLISLRSTDGPGRTVISAGGGTAVTIRGAAEISGFTITGGVASFGAGMEVGGVGTVVRNNVFDGNRQTAGGFGAAIGGNGASPVIDGNVFRNNSADSQHLSGVVSFVNGSSPVIVNNLFVDNAARGINLTLPAGNNPRIYNNTFVRNHTAVKYGSFPPAAVFRNNILTDNTTGFQLDYPNDLPVFEDNLVWNNRTNYVGMQDPTGRDGNLMADPMFLDPRSDFRLSPGSPALDAGTSLGAPDHDLLGHRRPAGAGIDMGAYELPEPSAAGLLIAVAGLLTCRRGQRVARP